MNLDFQTGHFVDFEQFKFDSHFANFGQGKIYPSCLFLQTLDKLQLFYWVWAKHSPMKNNANPLHLTKIAILFDSIAKSLHKAMVELFCKNS